MGSFKLRPTADRDLQNIYRYSVKEWGSDRAERYIRDIETTFQQLANNVREHGQRRLHQTWH